MPKIPRYKMFEWTWDFRGGYSTMHVVIMHESLEQARELAKESMIDESTYEHININPPDHIHDTPSIAIDWYSE